MNWKGLEIDTVWDLINAVNSISTRNEAYKFMRAYIESVGDQEIAQSNVGYITGYLSSADRHKICHLFSVTHPIFGDDDLSPEELFALGQLWGRGELEYKPQPKVSYAPVVRNILREEDEDAEGGVQQTP